MTRVRIPAHGWQPRAYQLPVLSYFADGGKRAVLVMHRRAGKDELSLQIMAIQALSRVGSYLYMLPEASHVRRAVWDMVNPGTGRRRIDDIFPAEIVERRNDQQMRIDLRNGSNISFYGSDEYDRLVGGSYAGLVFSEYALADPRAWSMLRPVLAQNEGWALFQGTPRGRNHYHDLFELAGAQPDWFAQITTADQTDVFAPDQLEREREELVRLNGDELGNSIFRQEYMCSFEGAQLGAYYAHLIERAENEGRVMDVPYDPTLPVETGWDLGRRDATAVWFVQTTRSGMKHVIDYLEVTGRSFSDVAPLVRQKGYNLAPLQLPHDGAHETIVSPLSVQGTALSLGFQVEIVARHGYDDQINAVRSILPRCLFDRERTKAGRVALTSYHATFDEGRKVLSPVPVHDWASHGASAFATYALGMQQRKVFEAPAAPFALIADFRNTHGFVT